MQNLTYKELQKIEISATKKLLNYISMKIQNENLLDELEFYYPDFSESIYRLAFNIWLSIDYINMDGKTFIEKLLEENTIKLSPEERQVLIERNKSSISLFEILFADGEYIKVLDLLRKETYDLWEPELSGVLSIGDYIFARTGNLMGHMTFIGDISYLPPSMKQPFIREVFVDFNKLRMENPNLTMEEYQKKHSMNLYRIYTDCVFDAMDMDEDIISILYDEIDEFEAYLQLKEQGYNIKKHLSNLMEFFEYYLVDDDLTLYDCDLIDFNIFFEDAINNGFIKSQEDLNSYISTFKNYLRYLSFKNESYRESYNEILDISKRRFEFMNELNSTKYPFKINKGISDLIVDILNKDSISLLLDYDKFILYVLDRPLELTEKNKFIKKKNLLEINNMLEYSTSVDKKAIGQKDFPIIDLFYKFSLSLNLLSIEDNMLTITNIGNNYLRLKDEEKFTLFFQYIWSDEFMQEVTAIDNTNKLYKLKKDLVDLLYSLEVRRKYEISQLIGRVENLPKFFFKYYEYLQYLGIIICNLYPNYEMKLTSLGKTLMKYLKFLDENKVECNIIKFDSFNKSK